MLGVWGLFRNSLSEVASVYVPDIIGVIRTASSCFALVLISKIRFRPCIFGMHWPKKSCCIVAGSSTCHINQEMLIILPLTRQTPSNHPHDVIHLHNCLIKF